MLRDQLNGTIGIAILRSMYPNANGKLIVLHHIIHTTLSTLPMGAFVSMVVSMWNSD